MRTTDSLALPGDRQAAWLRLLVLLAIWLVALAVTFSFKRSQLFIGLDGGLMRELARQQFANFPSPFVLPWDLLQGIGDVTFTGVNYTLIPAFAVGAPFGEGSLAKVVSYTWIAGELAAATYFLATCLTLSRAKAVAAAVITCFLVFPVYQRGLVYPVASLAPHLFSFVAGSMAAVGCYWKYGRRGWREDWPYALVAFLLLTYMFFAAATVLILAVPFLALCGVAGIFGAAGRAERVAKLALIGLALLLLVALGPAAYMAGLLLNSAALVFATEFVNNRTGFEFASIVFHWRQYGPAGPILAVLAMLGAAWSVRDRSSPLLRALAIVMVTYFITRVSFWILTVLVDFYRGPSALYFEFFVLPLYVVFAVTFVVRLWSWLLGLWTKRQVAIPPGYLVGGLGVLAIVLAATSANPRGGFEYPPAATPITEAIIAANASSSSYPGRAVTMTGQGLGEAVGWHALVMNDLALFNRFGNEMRIVGLHHFGIPSLLLHSSTVSPAFYLLTSRTLTLPADPQLRSGTVWRRFNPRILAMLGVRFVIIDKALDGGAKLLTQMDGPDGQNLYLYEIPNPNLGTYSPTELLTATTIGEAVATVASDGFDPTAEVVVAAPLGTDGALVPAHDARLAREGLNLRVTATSASKSILLLPLEFSRCLVVSGSGEPTLFRANVAETGVLFSGTLDASISVQYGPVTNPWCRLQDLYDVVNWGAAQVTR